MDHGQSSLGFVERLRPFEALEKTWGILVLLLERNVSGIFRRWGDVRSSDERWGFKSLRLQNQETTRGHSPS